MTTIPKPYTKELAELWANILYTNSMLTEDEAFIVVQEMLDVIVAEPATYSPWTVYEKAEFDRWMESLTEDFSTALAGFAPTLVIPDKMTSIDLAGASWSQVRDFLHTFGPYSRWGINFDMNVAYAGAIEVPITDEGPEAALRNVAIWLQNGEDPFKDD